MNRTKRELRTIQELSNNSRISCSELAKIQRVSTESESKRIAKLEKEGIIQSYTTLISIKSVGYETHKVQFSFQYTRPKEEEEIIQFLKNLDSVIIINRVSEYYDIIFQVKTKTIQEFNEIMMKFQEKFDQKIDVKGITTAIEEEYFLKPFMSSEKKIDISLREKPYEGIDTNDLKILSELSKNSRVSLKDLAKETGLNYKTITSHIKNMEKEGVIAGYSCRINYSKLGLISRKVEIQPKTIADIKNLHHIAKNNDKIVFYRQSLQEYPVDYTVICFTINEFNQIIKEIKKELDYQVKIRTYEEIESIKFKGF